MTIDKENQISLSARLCRLPKQELVNCQKSQLDVDFLLEEVQTEGPVDQDIGDGIEQRGKLVAEDAAIAGVVEKLVYAGVAQQIIDAEGYEQQV